MASKYTVIRYDGVNYGALYLEDVGVRPQLGRGVMGTIGQDIVVNPGDCIALVNSGNVLLSREKGILKKFEDAFVFEETDTLAGVTGLGIRSGTVGTKTDPSNTVGDF